MKEVFVTKGRALGLTDALLNKELQNMWDGGKKDRNPGPQFIKGKTATSYLIMPWYRKLRIRFSMWRLRRSIRKSGGTLLQFSTGWGPNYFFHQRNIMGNLYNELFSPKNITAKLSEDYTPGDKYLHTEDWGTFKFRKNGRVRLMVGEKGSQELIKCTPVQKDREEK